MVKVKKDLTGQVFGRLTVIKQVEDYIRTDGKHVAQWLCQCSCKKHTEVVVIGQRLKNGETQSCGCFQKELLSKRQKKTNVYNIDGEYGIGWTTNTNKEFYFDIEDYDKIKDYCWIERENKSTGGHRLTAKIGQKHVPMFHLLGFKGHDHENRNPFDNRKNNLRPATAAENSRNRSKPKNNTSGFVGVSWDKRSSKWISYITVNNKRFTCGYFDNKQDAIIARLKAEIKYFGSAFSPQRHLFEEYNIISPVEDSTKLMEE